MLRRCLPLVCLLLVAAAACAEQVYYANDFEATCDLAYWASHCKVEVTSLALSGEQPFRGQRCAKLQYRVTEGDGWCYFKIPIDVAVDFTKTYVLEAALRYETSGGTRVSFGHSWQHQPPGQAQQQGNTASAGAATANGQWSELLSPELGESYRSHAEQAGFTADCPGRFDALYIHTEGNTAGDTVTIWLDEVRLREATAADRARWAKDRRPFDYVPPAYRAVEEASPWGCCGSLEGYHGRLNLPLEVEAALVARAWADLGFDTSIRPGGMVMAPGSAKAEDYLGQFLDLNARYGLKVLPSTYLTNYYNRKVPREECTAAIKRVVARFRNHPALCAWWMIDEPMPNREDIGNQWLWGKQQFEALDKQHPALGALCFPAAVAAYSQYTQVAIIDCYPLVGTAAKPGGNPAAVAQWCELSWQRGARRIWAVQQAFGELGNWRLPTRSELRLMTYLYLSRGTTGFLPYYYTMEPAWLTGNGHSGLTDLFGAPTHLGEEICDLAETVMPLSAAFVPVQWRPLAQARPAPAVTCEQGAAGQPLLDVSFLAGRPGPDPYDLIVVCNLDTAAPRRGALRFTPPPGRTLCDLQRLLPVTRAADGSVSFHLEPGGAAVYLSGSAQACSRVKALLQSRRVLLWQRRFAGLVREAEGSGIHTGAKLAARAEALARGG